MPLTLSVNGEPQLLEPSPDPACLSTVIPALGHNPALVVVELNGVIIPKSRWTTSLSQRATPGNRHHRWRRFLQLISDIETHGRETSVLASPIAGNRAVASGDCRVVSDPSRGRLPRRAVDASVAAVSGTIDAAISGGYRSNYGGGYRGGGDFGFPFLIPIFDSEVGVFFGLLILMAIAGVLVNAIPRSWKRCCAQRLQRTWYQQLKQGEHDSGAGRFAGEQGSRCRKTCAPWQRPRHLLIDRLAALPAGNNRRLRQPELWVLRNAENGTVPFSAAESTFNRLSMSERSKLQAEVTSNVGGRSSEPTLKASVGDADATNEFIIVTLVASTATAKLQGADTGEDLRQTLRILGSTSSSELMALEVIWQPEGRGDVLSAEELITAYPNLQHL